MKNNQLPFCPYCNKKLKYFEAWFLHREGEYVCPKCGYNSKISYTHKLKTFLIFSIVISISLAVLFTLIGNVNLIEVIIVLIPFFLFYILVPFFMILKKTQQKSYLNQVFADPIKEEKYDTDVSMQHTNIMSNSKIKSKFENSGDDEKTKIIDAIK